MKPVVVDYPPVIVRMPWKNKTYGVSGGTWLEIPSHITLAELPQYLSFRGWKSTEVDKEKAWAVKGSKGNLYTVKLSNEGGFSCTCMGYGFRRKCKHIDTAKKNG